MEKLYTVAEVAKRLKCHRSTVTRIAIRLKLKTRIANALVFTADEVAKIEAAAQGRPGNPGGEKAAEAGRKGGKMAGKGRPKKPAAAEKPPKKPRKKPAP